MNNINAKRIVSCFITISFLIGITIISFFVYFNDGIPEGDDFSFHLGNIYDTYYGLVHGLGLDSTNHLMMGAYAYNTHMFYAPLPHYFAAIIMAIFNCSNIVAVKITIFFFCFIAAVFFYCFAKKISKNILIAYASTAFFVFIPYRMFCSYCRFAYAETIAISLIPVFFNGIYSITHDEKPLYSSFLTVILGVSGLILSHPFTALISVIDGLLYMAVKYKGVWRFLKTKKGFILSVSTVVLIITLIGFYLFPMIMAQSSGLYRISDSEAVWTTYEHVSESTSHSSSFSGFLDSVRIEECIMYGLWPSNTNLFITLYAGIILLVIDVIIVVLIDYVLSKLMKNKFIVSLITTAISVLMLVFFGFRLEIYFALILFDILYFLSKFIEEKNDSDKENSKATGGFNWDVVTDVIYLFIITFLTIMFIYGGQLWKALPSIFYSCQFAWRLWSIVSFIASWLFIIILVYLNKLKTKAPLTLMMLAPSLMLGLSQAYPEKSYAYSFGDQYGWVVRDFGEEELMLIDDVGVMNEYIPSLFYDFDYHSQYGNSLYQSIRMSIGKHGTYIHSKEDYDVALLTGSGYVACTELNTPNVILSASIDEDDSLIQIPQFFYDGYEISVYRDNEYVTNIDVINIDSLVSFKLDKGEYTIKVNYKGPKIRRVFNVLFFVGLFGVLALATLAVIEKRRIGKEVKEA